MTASAVIWLAVAAILFTLILIRVFTDNAAHAHEGTGRMNHRPVKFIELGKEREEFFAAGDPLHPDADED